MLCIQQQVRNVMKCMARADTDCTSQTCHAFFNTFSKGGIISLEIHGAVIKPKDDINKEYYHSAVTTADVLESKVNAPKDSKATELLANVSAITASK